MAIYYCNLSSISKNTQQQPLTSVSHVAYQFREEKYAKQSEDVLYKEAMLDGDLISGQEYRQFLKSYEETSRKNARILDKIVVALPKEFNAEQQIKTIQKYVKSLGEGALSNYSFAIHKDEVNPHAHIAFVGINAQNKKIRVLYDRDNTQRIRKLWSEAVNDLAKQYGLDVEIDHRSYEEQGLEEKEKTKKVGWRRGKRRDEIIAYNETVKQKRHAVVNEKIEEAKEKTKKKEEELEKVRKEREQVEKEHKENQNQYEKARSQREGWKKSQEEAAQKYKKSKEQVELWEEDIQELEESSKELAEYKKRKEKEEERARSELEKAKQSEENIKEQVKRLLAYTLFLFLDLIQKRQEERKQEQERLAQEAERRRLEQERLEKPPYELKDDGMGLLYISLNREDPRLLEEASQTEFRQYGSKLIGKASNPKNLIFFQKLEAELNVSPSKEPEQKCLVFEQNINTLKPEFVQLIQDCGFVYDEKKEIFKAPADSPKAQKFLKTVQEETERARKSQENKIKKKKDKGYTMGM